MFSDYQEHGPVLLGDAEYHLRADFRLSNTNVTIANTIRRAVLTQTPSIGFRTEPYDKSEVNIIVNTTPLVNEMIAHRIGMIPVNADPVSFIPELFTFELDVENNTKDIIDVRAGDFRVYMRNPKNPLDAPIQVDTATIFPPDPITGDTILITRLRPQWNPTAQNERLQVNAKACISSGTENIRWSPVSQVSYEYTQNMDPDKLEQVFVKWVQTYKKIDDVAALDVPRREELIKEFNTMEIKRCFVTDEKGDPNDFTFHVESVGVQPIPHIIRNALVSCDVLVTKYQDIDTLIPSNVSVRQGDTRYSSIEFIFRNETHTLGNLLANWLIDNEAKDGSQINYAGYTVPHPLRPEMIVRVGVKEGMDVELQKQTARSAISKACKALKNDFRKLTESWTTLVGETPVYTGTLPGAPIAMPVASEVETKDEEIEAEEITD
jgi:DNA-directed RNA polymerase subunit L